MYNKMLKGGMDDDEKRRLLAGKVGGAGGASGFGVFSNGTSAQQMQAHPFSSSSSTDSSMLLTKANPMGWKGGKGKSHKRGGSNLMRAAVPALLVLASNSYKRRGSKTRGKRSYRSRRTFKSRR